MSVAWDESYQGQLRALAGDDRPLLFIGARCVAVDPDDRLLLIRRADNGEWALPAGAMELGESIGECAARELTEETGLVATSLEPFAFYSGARFTGRNTYGHTYQLFSTAFWIRSWAGELARVTDETTDATFYPIDQLPEGLVRSVAETVDDFGGIPADRPVRGEVVPAHDDRHTTSRGRHRWGAAARWSRRAA